MTPRHVYMTLMIMFAAGVVLAGGCSQETPPATGGSVTIGLLSEPTTLNPLVATSSRERSVISLLFLKLLKEKDDLFSFEPALARAWSFSDDGLAVGFKLRDDVTWHDGMPVTAHDVAFSYDLATNPDAAWSGRHFMERIGRVEVVSDYEVVFHFTHRYIYQLMDAADALILPKHLLEGIAPDQIRGADFGRQPVGNGPFKLAEWAPSQHIRLVRNENYFDRGLPRLDEVVFRFIPDETALMTALKAGDVDCVEFFTPDVMKDPAEADDSLNLIGFKGREMSFVAWNTQRAPFDDRELRRALALAIDANAVIGAAWNGLAAISDSPMHPLLWPHDPAMTPIPFDPVAARQALAALGWRDSDGDGVVDRAGKALKFEMLTNQGNQQRIDAITIIQAQLKGVGVAVELRVLEWSAFMQAVIRDRDFDACLFGYDVAGRADLKNYWATGANFNVSGYSNAVVDTLIDRARALADAEDARPLWAQCQRIIYDDQPHYFLAVPSELMAIHKRYCNVQPNAVGPFDNLPEWYIGDDCD